MDEMAAIQSKNIFNLFTGVKQKTYTHKTKKIVIHSDEGLQSETSVF